MSSFFYVCDGCGAEIDPEFTRYVSALRVDTELARQRQELTVSYSCECQPDEYLYQVCCFHPTAVRNLTGEVGTLPWLNPHPLMHASEQHPWALEFAARLSWVATVDDFMEQVEEDEEDAA